MAIKNAILGLLWTIFIVVICLIPGDNLPESSFFGDLPIDKIVHFLLYFVLFILMYVGFNKMEIKYSGLITFFYCLILGVVIEILQENFFKGRSGDIFDVLANVSGALCGWLSYIFVFLNWKKQFLSNGKK